MFLLWRWVVEWMRDTDTLLSIICLAFRKLLMICLLLFTMQEILFYISSFIFEPQKWFLEVRKIYINCNISKSVIFFVALWCYAITHVLCIYAVCMCAWWWSHHMTSSGKHYKRGFQLLVHHRECWLLIEYIYYSVCLR